MTTQYDGTEGQDRDNYTDYKQDIIDDLILCSKNLIESVKSADGSCIANIHNIPY